MDRESERDFCGDFGCPRLFALDDCSAAACPRSPGVISFFTVGADGAEHFVCNTNYRGAVMAYEAKIGLTITKDGAPYHTTELSYSNLTYPYVVYFEKLGADIVAGLAKEAELAANQKK